MGEGIIFVGMEKKTKDWMTLNAHGKGCLENFLYSISANDVFETKLDYLYKKCLVDYATHFRDLSNREEVANHALTDIGIATAKHYFPRYFKRTKTA